MCGCAKHHSVVLQLDKKHIQSAQQSQRKFYDR